MKHLLTLSLIIFWQVAAAQPTNMALIKGGDFVPLYGAAGDDPVHIQSFYMDITPVTHEAFAEFVKKYPKWQRSNVTPLFADSKYLNNWVNDTTPDPRLKWSPVNKVSWFAAKAYCECQGKRLPTVNEWEYVAMADEDSRDARHDSLYNLEIIASYKVHDSYKKPAGYTQPNYWGVKDLHGLVWEWTMDFNAIILTGEARNKNNEIALFCAAGAIDASDLTDYGAFMRYALRSSLKASFTLRNLGFRCVKDVNHKPL